MSSDEDISDFEGLNDPNEIADVIGSRDENAELSTRERPAYTFSEISSLYDLSLQSISRNLARYNLAFSKTEDIYFRRNLQFLQRRHSSYLISNQLVNGYLDESYWQFLINEYVTELNVGILANGNYDAALARIAEVGHGFRKIDFNFPGHLNVQRDIDFVNTVVSKTPNAILKTEILNFHSLCCDQMLQIISSSCLNLKELYLDASSVTSEGLKFLCQEKKDGVEASGLKLKILSLSSVPAVNDGVIYLLRNMPSLEMIVHQHLETILYEMHRDELSNSVRPAYNLTTTLDLNSLSFYPNVIDILSVFTCVCPHIKKVSLSNVEREHLELLCSLVEIEELCVAYSDPGEDIHFDHFLKCRGATLRILKVKRFKLSLDVLMQSCPRLEVLGLEYPVFEQRQSYLKPLYNLRELNLERLYFDNDHSARQSLKALLRSSRNLRRLTVKQCELNCAKVLSYILKFCERARSLKDLAFHRCDVKEPFLKEVLLSCSSLRVLVVDRCKHVGSSQFRNLQNFSRSLKTGVKVCSTHPDNQVGFIDFVES